MIRLARVRTIAFFELRATVTRPAFIATTLFLPLVLFGLSGGSIALQGFLLAERLLGTTKWAVVDESGAVDARLADAETELVPMRTRTEALRALRSHEVDGAIVVPRDWLATGRVELYASRQRSPFDPPAEVPALVTQTLISHLLDGDVTEAERARVLAPALAERFVVTTRAVEAESAERMLADVLTMVIPIVFGVLFLTALLTASGYLVQAVAADKETRAAEVLLACVTPDEVLFGKLVGLGAAGLLQLAVWVTISSSGAALLGSKLAVAVGVVPLTAVLLSPVLFLAGYFFLGSLMLVTGALGSSSAEAQKLSVIWALLGVSPTFFLVAFMDSPHAQLPRMMSLFPPTAPLALMLRLGMDPSGVAAWEVPVALLELAACTYVVLRIGARLFAFGLLRTSLPSPRELVRALRGR